MKIEITVCDLDQAVGVPTKRYTITVEGRTVELDLCEVHAGSLESLMDIKAPQPEKPARPRAVQPKKRTTRTRPRIVSMEEIEEMKQ
ncbi:DNA binding protein [Streptomyces phage Izzy]|uniref:DNA binding protein n=6 Tax=Likavirus izzy TaxID=1982888 RepID=A0A2U8UTK6_9CAUD|nr:DNA binding protein [Streptomyces phage Izzy]ATE84982.1 DNA binding protein [Streptomyces phage BryanRecycles]ATE85283.1 DNA binding protein [Streptomyces phage Jash]ATE85359.1 DNA binding protein [Streptomyces phage Oliynyk]AWN07472.1 DNA binding protein [Streptomyces phage Eddasa]QDK03960.1 DNA binding protein [Streptomyces phage Rusticus]WJN62884.1 hypothetical protein [Streptomyces phage phiScoe23]